MQKFSHRWQQQRPSRGLKSILLNQQKNKKQEKFLVNQQKHNRQENILVNRQKHKKQEIILVNQQKHKKQENDKLGKSIVSQFFQSGVKTSDSIPKKPLSHQIKLENTNQLQDNIKKRKFISLTQRSHTQPSQKQIQIRRNSQNSIPIQHKQTILIESIDNQQFIQSNIAKRNRKEINQMLLNQVNNIHQVFKYKRDNRKKIVLESKPKRQNSQIKTIASKQLIKILDSRKSIQTNKQRTLTRQDSPILNLLPFQDDQIKQTLIQDKFLMQSQLGTQHLIISKNVKQSTKCIKPSPLETVQIDHSNKHKKIKFLSLIQKQNKERYSFNLRLNSHLLDQKSR